MNDREKIIAALENCSDPAGKCRDCPYEECVRLEKSVSEYPDELIWKAVELLKEQEPRLMDGSHCPSCNFSFGWTVDELGGTGNVNYCPHCGQAVKWDA